MNQPPYAPPNAGADPGPIVDLLKDTGPWVRLLAILGFIGTGLMVLVAALMLLAGAFFPAFGEKGIAAGAMAVLYLVLAGVYLVPSLLMNNYANAIARAADGGWAGITGAVDAQRKLWKFVGILCIVFVGLTVLATAVAFVAGLAGAFSGIK